MADAQFRDNPPTIPPEVDRWNWGAFLLNWIWGVGNNTFIALLTLVPLIGLVMPFVLGAKGSKWAWRNGRWDSIAHFQRVQRLWAIWGVVIWFGAIALFGGIFGGTFYLLKHSEAYQLGAARLQASTQAVDALGAPISTGTPFGKIAINGASGRAALNFSVTGSKAAGRVFLEAVKQDGIWSLTALKLKIEGREDVIDLLRESRVELETPSHVPLAKAGAHNHRPGFGEDCLPPGATDELRGIGRGLRRADRLWKASVLEPHLAEAPHAQVAEVLDAAGLG